MAFSLQSLDFYALDGIDHHHHKDSLLLLLRAFLRTLWVVWWWLVCRPLRLFSLRRDLSDAALCLLSLFAAAVFTSSYVLLQMVHLRPGKELFARLLEFVPANSHRTTNLSSNRHRD